MSPHGSSITDFPDFPLPGWLVLVIVLFVRIEMAWNLPQKFISRSAEKFVEHHVVHLCGRAAGAGDNGGLLICFPKQLTNIFLRGPILALPSFVAAPDAFHEAFARTGCPHTVDFLLELPALAPVSFVELDLISFLVLLD